MGTKEQCLFIGIGSYVVAIRPFDGQEIWRTRLKMSSFVTVQAAGDVVYAGAGGELFCLDGASGAIRWRNKLKGLGNGLVSFAGSSTVEAAAAFAAAQAAAAGATVAAMS
jgi:outer membrane protein assembly factor BamB